MSNLDKLSEEAVSVYHALDAYKVGCELRETITNKLNGEYNKLQEYIGHLRHRRIETRPEIEGVLTEIETYWLEDRYEKAEPFVTADGKWKYRTLLPKGYSSAKSVLLSAVELNVFGVGVGKSELEKRIREAKRASSTSAIYSSAEIMNYLDAVERSLLIMFGPSPDPFVVGQVVGRLTKLRDNMMLLVPSTAVSP